MSSKSLLMLKNNLDQTKHKSCEGHPLMNYTVLTLCKMLIWNVKKSSVKFSQEARWPTGLCKRVG